MIDDFETRVKFMMQHYDFSASRATHVVNREDRRRTNLYQKLGKTDYENPSLYDLVLNMGRLNMQTAVKLVCGLVQS
jgi:cytidylate kinase